MKNYNSITNNAFSNSSLFSGCIIDWKKSLLSLKIEITLHLRKFTTKKNEWGKSLFSIICDVFNPKINSLCKKSFVLWLNLIGYLNPWTSLFWGKLFSYFFTFKVRKFFLEFLNSFCNINHINFIIIFFETNDQFINSFLIVFVNSLTRL